ncbi:hypothetical protein [uncultured Aquimarina sp.]|uniref:hypothetical protein n=1 Tax=uncultured Aquimarina sp. TaxID=575652 RepID=UPI002630226C|nr:hypothetical protein [uncultured Aquimarina sp.]
MKKIRVLIVVLITIQMVDAILHLTIDRIEPLRLVANLIIILSVACILNFRKLSFNILMSSLFLYVLLNSIWFGGYISKVIHEDSGSSELFFIFLLLTIGSQFFMIHTNLTIKNEIDLTTTNSFKIKQ